MPATQNTDIRLEKSINVVNDQWVHLFIRVTNVFNNKNLRSYGDAIYDAEASKKFVEEGIVSTVYGAGYDISWMNYFDQQKIYLGVKYRF